MHVRSSPDPQADGVRRREVGAIPLTARSCCSTRRTVASASLNRKGQMMKRRRYSRTLASLLVLAVLGLRPAQASAEERLIVRTSGLLGGLPVVKSVVQTRRLQRPVRSRRHARQAAPRVGPRRAQRAARDQLLDARTGHRRRRGRSGRVAPRARRRTQAPLALSTRIRSTTTARRSAAATSASRPSRSSASLEAHDRTTASPAAT